jgi:hypothetical protein
VHTGGRPGAAPPLFVATAPLEGLGASVQLLNNLCRDDAEALDEIDKAIARPVGTNQHSEQEVDNVNGLERPVGNSRDAALRRLRKDRADLLGRVKAGESGGSRSREPTLATSLSRGETVEPNDGAAAGAP